MTQRRQGMHREIKICLTVVFVLFSAHAISFAQDKAPNAKEPVNETATPLVHFNHFYIVVDDDTFDEIKNSEFIKNEFGGIHEESTTTEKGETYKGGYLIGRKSYIELFNSQGLEGAKEGTVGIGFSTQKAGDLEVIYDRFKAEFGDTASKDLREMVSGEAKFPWFNVVSSLPEDNKLPFACWVMEMHPLHLSFFGAKPDSNGIVSRENYWEAVNKKTMEYSGKPYLPERCFNDITSLELVLTQNELERFSKELSACGYLKNEGQGGASFQGPGIKIKVQTENDPTYRISSLTMTLENKLGGPIDLQFGNNARLKIASDSLGRWQFGKR
jgi:hypothetical protein